MIRGMLCVRYVDSEEVVLTGFDALVLFVVFVMYSLDCRGALIALQ